MKKLLNVLLIFSLIAIIPAQAKMPVADVAHVPEVRDARVVAEQEIQNQQVQVQNQMIENCKFVGLTIGLIAAPIIGSGAGLALGIACDSSPAIDLLVTSVGATMAGSWIGFLLYYHWALSK